MTIRHVAVIGTGLIGASWAAYFMAQGLQVTAYDPAPGAEAALWQEIERLWPAMMAADPGLTTRGESLRFAKSVADAVAHADFVQENGPERIAVKQALFTEMDAASPPAAILASSSSTLRMSEVQSGCKNPGRVLLGHPFNPPHLIPLVEVVGGALTDEAAIAGAMAFYAAIGKVPIRLHKEVVGHVANRLQAALWREAIHLLLEGVADVPALDAAIAQGPGLRWALLGPFMNLHLSGGAGGMAHTLAHLGPAIETMWRDLGTELMTPEVVATVVQNVTEANAGTDLGALVKHRDKLLAAIVAHKREAGL